MQTGTALQNWKIGSSKEILNAIHNSNTNIAIYEREVDELSGAIDELIAQKININAIGDLDTIQQELTYLLPDNAHESIRLDVITLLNLFTTLSNTKSVRLTLAVIDTNMCPRFHTDANDLRLLCTYRGMGTLWLKEENINRTALNTFKDNTAIVLNEDDIQQAKAGAVTVLKGSKFPSPETLGAVHRSPTLAPGEKRLLLRIDTN